MAQSVILNLVRIDGNPANPLASGATGAPSAVVHGALQTVLIPSMGTKPDYNTGGHLFAGHPHRHVRFVDFENATGPVPAVNTKAAFEAEWGGVFPIDTDTDFNDEAVFYGAILNMTAGAPTHTGRAVQRIITAAQAEASGSFRLKNFNAYVNTVYRQKLRIGCWVWAKADFTLGKFWRDYHSPSTSLSWNWYAGLQINNPVFATLSSVVSSQPSLTNGQTATVTINFASPMTGLYVTDINPRPNSGISFSRSAFTRVSDTQYTVVITAIGTITDVEGDVVPSLGGTKPFPYIPSGGRGYGFSWRAEGNGNGYQGGYADTALALAQEDQWIYFERLVDFTADEYATFVNQVIQIDTDRGYTGWVSGQIGADKIARHGLLGNTIDPRGENGEKIEWAEISVDFDWDTLWIANSSVWANKTLRPVKCPQKSCIDGVVEFIVNDGGNEDVSTWHLFHDDGKIITHLRPLGVLE